MYNPQMYVERLNNQIRELEAMKGQIPQPITQNFQIAPSGNTLHCVDSIEEVEKNMIIGDTPFFSKDLSILWIKNTKGEIRTFELKEIVQKDEKDLKIEYLQAQMDKCCCDLRAQGIENTQKILDAMNQNTIDSLRSEVNDLKNTITANGIGTSIVNQVRPYPIPAYPVSSPYVGLYNGGFYGNGFYGNTIV